MSPLGSAGEKGLLAAGIAGSALIRLEMQQSKELLEEETVAEAASLVEKPEKADHEREFIRLTCGWLQNWEKICARERPAGQNLASETPPESSTGYLYLSDDAVRQKYHRDFLQSASDLWESARERENKRLREKQKHDQRLMANTISGLASLHRQETATVLREKSGVPLLDACRLVGRNLHIDISAPPRNDEEAINDDGTREFNLDDIVRASRIRPREVALRDEWYKQDNGPILGFMAEDDRPVALIPDSPSKYVLHDFTRGIEKVVDKDTAAEIKYLGFVFYRPFENKQIALRDLLSFGYKSCWRRDLVMIALMGVLGGLLGTAVPVATGIVFDSIIPEGEGGQLLQIAFFLVAAALASMLFQFTRALATLRLEGKMDGSLQAAVWDRLLSLPVPFFRQYTAGELAMRAMGISQIRVILSGVTLNSILSGIFSIFTLALLFYYDIRLAGVAALLVVVAILVMGYLSFKQVRYEHKVLELSNRISGMMLQFIGGVAKFRVAGAENRAFHRWAQEFGRQRQLSFQRETLGNFLTTFNAFFPILSSMVIFYALTAEVGTLAPGQFIAFNSAFTTFMLSMASLSESLIRANLVIPLYQKAKPILETLPEDDKTKASPKTLSGSLEVSHVSFRYKEDGPLALQDVSLQINEGDYVALVGTSGSGKSTLFRILLGFEQPEKGKVYYDGQDLSKVDIRAVRRQLGVVLQNGQLMSGNIFSNIVGANPYLTIEDAWEAARMAGLEEDIKDMPMGMHTMISEGAGTISGGQKQRLLIARAIVNKPRLIFFDEATSALDNHTQAIVSHSLDKLRATRIVIAHRLSTIINCDKILVMDQGKIVERGTYQELMEKNGIFASLARRQLA